MLLDCDFFYIHNQSIALYFIYIHNQSIVLYLDTLLDSHRTGMSTPDDSDSESKNLTAVRTKSGELKFVSGGESSGEDILESSRA